MPPLTSRGGVNPSGVPQEIFEQTANQERAFCEARSDQSNCGCFAMISTVVLTSESERIPGFSYAEQRELARGQAADAC